jgi:hypothetical protein
MNTASFTTTAKRLLQTKASSECFHTNEPQVLRWKDEADGWTYTFQANWLAAESGLNHDVHVTARKKGERHTFSVWFERSGNDYRAV